jgi:hypothetical protein
LNKPQNATDGGHFAMFLCLCFISAAQTDHLLTYLDPVPQEFNLNLILTTVALLLLVILLFVIGLWSSRTELDDEENVSREQGASILSRLFFSWSTPLIRNGLTKSIEANDIWNLTDAERSETVLKEYYATRYYQANHEILMNHLPCGCSDFR